MTDLITKLEELAARQADERSSTFHVGRADDEILDAIEALRSLQARNDELVKALKPFANVAEQIRGATKDERWLEKVLFYMGDDNDPTKWSLTGRAFDRARNLILPTPHVMEEE